MFSLIAVTNRKLCGEDFLGRIRSLTEWGVDKLILREKDLSPGQYEELAAQVLEICRGSRTECILHTYADAALRLGADAVHLPLPAAEQEQKSLSLFRQLGISTHSAEQVRSAEALGASYVTYGHVFATDCKKGLEPRGISALEEICRSASLPVYAIGGIRPEYIEAVKRAGAAGVCIMSAAMQADEKTIRLFRG